MRRIWLVLGLLVAFLGATPVSARTPVLNSLKPGETEVLHQDVPINIVLVGFADGAIDKPTVLSGLSESSQPVVRYSQFYGLPGRNLGLEFSYNYTIIDADQRFSDSFFQWLSKQGTVGDPTLFQQCYSGTVPPDAEGNPDPCHQTGSQRQITKTRYINAVRTESWLEENARSHYKIKDIGYTVFFINWYGRSDFQDHVYVKTNFVDPDTGYSFGANRQSRKMIAWGGSSGRSWFYDFSAGPESWSGNYDINNADLDGDDIADYRIPPIWEYAAAGYRDPAELSGDISKLVRYVAINLLFTTSPLYDPLVTTPGLDGRKVVSTNVLQADSAADGRTYLNADYIRRELRDFQPYYDWKVDITQTNPIDSGALRALEIFNGITVPDERDCGFYPPYDAGGYSGELFCYFDANLSTYIPTYPERDYVGKVFAFNISDDLDTGRLLGFADDNWVDGTQSYVFMFDSPYIRTLGYGFSTTTVHEFGHHIGMSHPHDGYDSETGLDYNPTAEFYFVQSGDESDSIMSYIDLAEGFGQFDRDNMHRYETAGYLNRSNELVARLMESPQVGTVRGLVEDADVYAGRAKRNMDRWKYKDAMYWAWQSYTSLRKAAKQLNIDATPTQIQLQRIQPHVPFLHPVDPVRPPDRRMIDR